MAYHLHPLYDRVARFGWALGPQSPQAAAVKVLDEATELAAQPSVIEAADVLITLLGFCYRSGITANDLIMSASIKMDQNEVRRWALKADGTWQHVEE
jgi:hypothetical protein